MTREGRSLCGLFGSSALFINGSNRLTECSEASGGELATLSCFTVPVGFCADNLSG